MVTARGRRPAHGAVAVALVLSVVLAVAAIVDQAGGRSLIEHADDVYASSGKEPSASVLYGLVYAVAVVDFLLWLLVLGVARSHRLLAAVLAVAVIAVSAGLAVLLLVSTEYDARIFPPLWGVLALLPAAAGVLAATLLLRGRSARG
ncbi:hypothetical protein [Streptomyces sp. IBSBF 2435]|uniref:hypothetical protein n=1 Tax=Streptomyces sp. IBSBF 2435 TaxID=2903531 RepID=UPI002FDC2CA4